MGVEKAREIIPIHVGLGKSKVWRAQNLRVAKPAIGAEFG